MTAALPSSPSAERNKAPILAVLEGVLPATGTVLEVASGTGQHVVHFAGARPALEWQPSEADEARRATVAARVAAAGLANLRAPLALDVRARPWPLAGPVDAVLAINLIHIAPWEVTLALVAGAAAALAARPAGLLLLYGPYREGGVHTAESNAAFDARLRAEDPAFGVRDLGEVAALAAAHGFAAPAVTRMPANNLTVVFRRAAP
jgi:SAM-dependent methyltransferase